MTTRTMCLSVYYSNHNLHKFTSSGEVIKCVGQEGKEGEFSDPRGVTLYNNQVYMCMYAIAITIVFRCLTWT